MVLVPLDVNPETPVVADAVHANVAPLTLDVKLTAVELLPEQIVCVRGVLVISGFGLTVIT
jgi:hypothetical protein